MTLNISGFVQISETPGKSYIDLKSHIFQARKMLESGLGPGGWNVVESRGNANRWCDKFIDDLAE